MKIPRELLHKIVWFVADHYEGKGFVSPPTIVGSTCGELAAGWIKLKGEAEEISVGDACNLVSICERLGKHLGSFYIKEREGEAWQQSDPQPTLLRNGLR